MPEAARSRARALVSGVPLFLIALAVAAGALVRASDPLRANHDIGWFLHAGEVWLDGGKIGVDVVDTNPPLVIWLSGLEVWVARALGTSPFVMHALATCAVGLAGVGLALRGFLRAGLERAALLAWAALTLSAATLVAGYEFGQREHWIALLLLPYAAWALVPRERTLERALVGLLAALAVALKPHYLLAVLVIELFGVLHLRSVRQLLRVELACAAACAPLYLVAIAWSAPTYWADARDTLAVYAAYDREVPLWSSHTTWALCALLLSAPFGLLRPGKARAPNRFPPSSAAPTLLASLALCSAAAAFLQHKNFAYHHIPTDVFSWSALAFLWVSVAGRFGRRPAVARGFALVVTLSCLAALVAQKRGQRDPVLRLALLDGLERLAPGEGVFVFSASVGATFPTVNFSDARSLSPYSCLWQIAGNYSEAERAAQSFPYRALEHMAPLERRVVERVVSLLERERPRLLVFDSRSFRQGFGRTSFDFQRYFEAHPRFVALAGSYESLARDAFFEYYGRRGE